MSAIDQVRGTDGPMRVSRAALLLAAALCGLTTFGVLEFALLPDDLNGDETIAALIAVFIPCALPLLCFERGRGFRAVTWMSVAWGIVMSSWGLGAVMLPVAVLQAVALIDIPARPSS